MPHPNFWETFWAKRLFFGTTFCIWGWVLGRVEGLGWAGLAWPGLGWAGGWPGWSGLAGVGRVLGGWWLGAGGLIAGICSRKHEWGLNTMPHPNFLGFEGV